ncbi:MAG: chromate resistance protein ChrB domain-containing protein [Gammaproteobacteria bacterium]
MSNLLALALTLPGHNTTARTRAWRALKAVGAAVLRDGVHVLPASPANESRLTEVAEDVVQSGGTAELWTLLPRDDDQRERFTRLFDRSADYAELISGCRELLDEPALDTPGVERRLKALLRQADQVAAIDFFPGEARAQARQVLDDARRRVEAALAPGEPAIPAGVPLRRAIADFQRRQWATRARPKVDRLASAWLIHRHIDTNASFLWLPSPADCPPLAVGFDFDGATFTHTTGRVTFETLLCSFGLDSNAALQRLGSVVHFLDVGGVPAPEAAGVAALLDGLRAQHANDDDLLAAALPLFDALLVHFSSLP